MSKYTVVVSRDGLIVPWSGLHSTLEAAKLTVIEDMRQQGWDGDVIYWESRVNWDGDHYIITSHGSSAYYIVHHED